jgi:hypothetical protein
MARLSREAHAVRGPRRLATLIVPGGESETERREAERSWEAQASTNTKVHFFGAHRD